CSGRSGTRRRRRRSTSTRTCGPAMTTGSGRRSSLRSPLRLRTHRGLRGRPSYGAPGQRVCDGPISALEEEVLVVLVEEQGHLDQQVGVALQAGGVVDDGEGDVSGPLDPVAVAPQG